MKGVSIPSMTVPHTANAVLQAGLELRLDGRTDWVGGRYLINGSKVVDSAHELRRDVFKYFPDDIKVCYSFYPTKTIGSADGGAVCTMIKSLLIGLGQYLLMAGIKKHPKALAGITILSIWVINVIGTICRR